MVGEAVGIVLSMHYYQGSEGKTAKQNVLRFVANSLNETHSITAIHPTHTLLT